MQRGFKPDYYFTSKFQRRFPVLAEMVMGRNVANVPSIEEFLKGFETDNAEINKWIHSALRKWLIRDYDKTKAYQPKASDPEWMQGKTDLVMVEMSEALHDQIQHVMDFLKAQAAANPNLKLNNFQVTEALKQSAEWTKKLQQKKTEEEVEGTDFEVITESGPYKWCKLISENALSREGNRMGHCVGGYWDQVQSGKVVIYSLRDSKNEPHATIEFNPRQKEIHQIKGKQNKGLNEEYRPALVEFLNSNKIGWKKIDQHDLNRSALLLGGDKKVFDKENIPDGATLMGPIKSYEGSIKFPPSIKITGDFVANDDQNGLPKTLLEVNGNCDISAMKSATLPEKLYVRKDFIASGCNLGGKVYSEEKEDYVPKVSALSKVFKVGGDVFLDDCEISQLPDGLTIPGELDLASNPISKLPKKLIVGGELDLMKTDVTVLPDDLQCDAIYVDDEAEMTVPEHLKDSVYQ